MRWLKVTDLGQLDYATALERQRAEHVCVAGAAPGAPGHGDPPARTAGEGPPWPLLLVEHVPPVITISRRAGAREHLVATPQRLEQLGVQVCQTDRGGDITWHGPGQLVAYPIVHLRAMGLGIHAYIRALEQGVITACAHWGVHATTETGNTGVWCGQPARKICAIGVRVSRWVTMHGLALNVCPDLAHFDLIVPCGLHGRQVTSLQQELTREGRTAQAPSMDEVKRVLAQALDEALERAREEAARHPPRGPAPGFTPSDPVP